MADLSREIFLRENNPELCDRWEATQWSLFHARLDEIGKGGMLTAAACRLVARGVNELMPAAPTATEPTAARKLARPHSKSRRPAKKIHEAPIVPLDPPEALTLHAPPIPVESADTASYFDEVRNKFELLLASRHSQSVSAFIEVLYRDIVFFPTNGPSSARDRTAGSDDL